MARPKSLIERRFLHASIKTSILDRLDFRLYSEAEGRIPHGAYQELLEEVLSRHLEETRLDLAAFGFPPGFYVSGPKEMIQSLTERLQLNDTRNSV